MKRDLGLAAKNKIDKGPKEFIEDNIEALKEGLGPSIPVFSVSARTDEGVGALKDEVRKKLAQRGFQSPFELVR
jgi:selenocysteine-specific translation elongation factor